MALPQSEPALIGPLRADEALLRHRRRGDAGNRGPSGMHPLRPGAVLQELQAARTPRQGDALRPGELLVAGAEQLSGRARAPRGAAGAGRTEPNDVTLDLGYPTHQGA